LGPLGKLSEAHAGAAIAKESEFFALAPCLALRNLCVELSDKVFEEITLR
jgi:hypothetical protein